MPIIGIIIFLIVVAFFWNQLFYIIGGILGLLGLLFIAVAKDEYNDKKLSDEQWHEKHPDKTERSDSTTSSFVVGIIFIGLCGLSLNYQTETWHNTELIAQQEEAEKQKKLQEEEQAKIEREKKENEEKIQKNIERANNLTGEYKNIYDTKFNEYKNAGNDENTSREKALYEVDLKIHIKENEAKKAAEEERKRLEEEQKAREAEEKAQRLAQAEQEKIARWGDKAKVKEVLEEIQPFALTNFIKNQAGIVGPLAMGDQKSLLGHAFFIGSLVKEARGKNEVGEQIANYLDYESKLAMAYAIIKSDNASAYEKAKAGAEIPQLLSKQQDARNKIQEIANWCGADLSEYGETEFIRRLRKKAK